MNSRILKSVAVRAQADAREAWREARSSPTDATVRAAMRACLLAARALRRAAPYFPAEHAEMTAAAARADAAVAELRDQLVRILETRRAVL